MMLHLPSSKTLYDDTFPLSPTIICFTTPLLFTYSRIPFVLGALLVKNVHTDSKRAKNGR